MGRATGRLTISARKGRRSTSSKSSRTHGAASPMKLFKISKSFQNFIKNPSSSTAPRKYSSSSSKHSLISSAPSPMSLAAQAERTSTRRSSTAAFLLRHALIFDSDLTVHQSSIWRLPSASLAALRPSSASLTSMRTSSASATQGRHTRGLSSASSVKREDFGGCAPSERLIFGASGISAGKRVTSDRESSTRAKSERSG